MVLLVAESAAGARGSVTPPPDELVASVAIGPAATRGTLRAYAEAVKPDLAAMLGDEALRHRLERAIGARTLDGLAADGMYVLVAEIDGAPSIGLLGKVADAKALTTGIPPDRIRIRSGWAVIGSAVLLDRIAAYALTVIAPQRAPVAPTAIVYLSQLLAHHRADLEAHRNKILGGVAMQRDPSVVQRMASYIDRVGALAAEIDRLIVTLEVGSDLGSLDVAVVPRPGSRLAKFVALQRPTDYALFGRLPAGSALFLGGGRLDLEPFDEGSRDLMALDRDAATAKQWRAGIERIHRANTGEFAFTGEFAPRIGMTGRVLWSLSRGVSTAAADAALRSWFERFVVDHTDATIGTPTTFKVTPGTTVEGVALRSYEAVYDFSKLPPGQRQREERGTPGGVRSVQVALFDGLGMGVVAPDAVADATRMIHAVRGKAPRFVASALVGRMFALSRARRESAAFVVDLGKFFGRLAGDSGSGDRSAMLSVGFADHNAHVRLAAPAAAVRAYLDENRGH